MCLAYKCVYMLFCMLNGLCGSSCYRSIIVSLVGYYSAL